VASSVTSGLEGGLAAGWTEVDRRLSGYDSTGSGLVCAENLATPLTSPNGTNAWGSDITVPAATLFTGPLKASVDGPYQDGGFDQNGITLEAATHRSIPKWAWLLLPCAGLLGLVAYKLHRVRQGW